MDPQTATLGVVAAIAAGLLGVSKKLLPALKAYVPNAAWPVLVAMLTAIGVQVCGVVGVACDGNPLEWDTTTLTAVVGGYFAVVLHQAARGIRWVARWFTENEDGEFFQ